MTASNSHPLSPVSPPLQRALSGRHLPALDGLRAIAVFTVIVYHFGIDSVPGDLGVSAFFVLSGFLITWLLLKEQAGSGTISLGQFYARRTLRIFPAYYVFLLVSLAIDSTRHSPWPKGLTLAGLFYFVNYFNALHGHPSTTIAHAWSLAIEEQFYLLWPLALLLLLQGGRKRAIAGLLAAITLVLTWRSFLYLEVNIGSAYVYNAFDTRFDNLAVGCLLALAVDQRWFRTSEALLTRSSALPIVTLVLLLLSRSLTSPSYHYSLGYTVDACLVAIFILQMLAFHQTTLWRWLEWPIIKYLGVISYPLYLWHAWGLSIGHHVQAAGIAGEFAVGVMVTIGLASASYHFVERPFLLLKQRFQRSEPRDRVTAAKASA